ncbi:MAG: tyrosine--tRNA ligase [Gemmataceae bacterium]|nr:tyrosine--tRNA ligase [Gemmataceae bacterium]
MKSVEEQLALIRRGAEQVVPEDEFRKKLERSVKIGKPLRVKYGIDPTGIDVHLGHTVPLRKLRLFQELGHQAVLIIGNYTALVGDPSGRDQTRARLTQEQVEANARDYLTQVSKVIDFSGTINLPDPWQPHEVKRGKQKGKKGWKHTTTGKIVVGDHPGCPTIPRTEVRQNGDWFKKFRFLDVMALTSKMTVQRMLERDDFTKRFRAEPSVPIYLHECLYPLMQGHDSVEIKADVELGGSEQLFNLMVGRRLQEDAGQEPQICLTLPILRGLDGERRMGKSLGNYIGVGEPAQVQFDKTMSIPDHLMREWFELLTDRTEAEIGGLTDPQRTHPMEAKKALGRDIVAFYHGADAARAAEAEWVKRFSIREDPTEIEEVTISASELTDEKMGISKLLVVLKMVASNNEGRRAVEGGGVNIGSEKTKITDPKAVVTVTDGLIVRFGSRRVKRVRLR